MKTTSIYWDKDKNNTSWDTNCSMIHGFSSIQELDSNKFVPSQGTKENLHSLNLLACNKDLEIILKMLEGGVAEPTREWKITYESPSKIAALIPISQANLIPSSIVLALVSRGPNGAWFFCSKQFLPTQNDLELQLQSLLLVNFQI